MAEVLFFTFATIAIGSAIGVVIARNPVGSLMFMVATLAAVAGIFVLLEAHFLAAIQVMVYAGAIMVLFLFVIMLLNLGHEYKRDVKGGLWSVMAFATTGVLGGLLVRQLGRSADAPTFLTGTGGETIDAALAEHGAVGAIARPLFTDYVVPFELVGILLLIAVVGAIVLAKKRV
ncbi:MAG: NADH-quinone oxidoreductase subunit J [Gemmatimonadota bacterium]|nr:MAG: NADH-quinone oxidoreductase subunit J [Gemmatimonadota bacterium]